MIEEAERPAVGLYESCVFDQLLGETLRPGGLGLTARLARVTGIGDGYTVLDTGCGKGTTAFFLAREYDCHVVGIDLSDEMISWCRSKAGEEGLTERVGFLLGDGENLPFCDGSFDAVISECSLSLLPNKELATRDIKRVLKPRGKLLITDFILRGDISQELRGQITFPCCLAGAWRVEEYISLFARNGFQRPYMEDHSHELGKVGYQLGMTLGSADNFVSRLPTGPCRRKGAGGLAPSTESYEEFLKLGRPGYALMAVTKG
jgi:SAM-dependent methyltransferase